MTASHEHPVAATPAYGSDVIVDLLAELDVPYVAFNPGASFRGLHDSLVNHANGTPQPIACLHEEISVAIAHGYAKATGRQMAAAVHDVVGLQHATMAVYNAWCDRVPLLLLGATGPVDAAKRRPWIDWIHTAQVQANQVRDYTKWDDQPASLEAVPESLIRAAQVSDTAPRGPVYICFDTEIQEQPVPQGWAPPVVASFAAPRRAAPDPAAVAELAGWLVGARAPVVLADYVGREQRAVEQLVALAELAGLAVVDLERSYNKVSLNFPTQHPLNLSGDAPAVLDAADVVIGLEARDLFGALNRVAPGGRVDPRHPGTARIASIGMGPCVKSAWSADYQRLQPCDLQLLCEPGPLLTALMPAVEAAFAEQPEAVARAGERRRRLEAQGATLRASWRAEARAAGSDTPIARSFLASVLDDVTRGGPRVVANGSLDNWIHRLWSLERAEEYLGDSGGGGLGYGLGASVGAALAHRDDDHLVIDVQSDGDALFTPSALWTAARERLPLLVVMDNNRGYNNSVEHAERVALTRGRPRHRREEANVIVDPEVDFAGLSRAFGVHGEGPVREPEELRPALERAVRIVREQRVPAVVDVVTGLTPPGNV